ncbi:MAG TPA: hypothetical protein VHK06_02910 [Candidatus Limnocylindria bacterium]|nr:hypothetical protein [Candidatus Limnocylindria bacterium]
MVAPRERESVVRRVAHERLADPGAAETAKASWKERLTALKSLLESTDV